MVDEGTVDCNNESEQATGLFTMMKREPKTPSKARVDISDRDEIIAICKRGGLTSAARF